MSLMAFLDKLEQNQVEDFFDLLVLVIDSELEFDEIELSNNWNDL